MNLDRVYGRPHRSVTRRTDWSWLDPLFPILCLACGKPAEGVGRPICLCLRCYGRLVPWPRAACAVCGKRLGEVPRGSRYRCRACRSKSPAYDALIAAWAYRPPLDSVITGLKFGRLDHLGPALGVTAAQALVRSTPSRLPAAWVVVPVPLHWWRRLGRGYNQAGLIAAGVSMTLGAPLLPALRRKRRTVPQSRLARPRRLRNPRGAFAVVGRLGNRVSARNVLLVDDVVTTGATVDACARCLKAAGARTVVALAVARTV